MASDGAVVARTHDAHISRQHNAQALCVVTERRLSEMIFLADADGNYDTSYFTAIHSLKY